MKKIRKLAKHNNSSGGLLFSEDMMTEIFLWLPLKSLIRFKRLSKRWYFLISGKDNNNSYFRRNYLSTLSTRKRNRIVGRSDDDDDDDDNSAIMAGFFYQKPPDQSWRLNDRIRFLPSSSTSSSQSQLIKKYSSFLPDSQEGDQGESTTTTTTATIVNLNFLSLLDESLDKFLSSCLHLDPDPTVRRKKFFVAGSSNGFLLLSLVSKLYDNYYLLNPVTMEWLALPKREAIEIDMVGIPGVLYVGFVCKGYYPSLDLVEYTIVRLSWLEERGMTLLFELFSNGNNEWSEYRVSCESPVEFNLTGQHNTVIVSTTTTTTNNQGGGGGGGGVVVYFLVMVLDTLATAIAVFDLDKGNKSLQMIETPGPDRGGSVYECDDYIREFDDGVIHYVRIFRSTDFEFWVLNTQSGEWYLKHMASLRTMKGYPWMDIHKWSIACAGLREEASERYHIHVFHPMNPNLIFLTLYGRIVCYNVETRMLELVYDFTTPQSIMLDDYCYYVYQWPCWPPLL